MKSVNKKRGNAYRNTKRKISHHAQKGKDRSKAVKGQSNIQTVTYNGWTAEQNISRKYIVVTRPNGSMAAEFMVDNRLSAAELVEYIKYCIKSDEVLAGVRKCL